MFDYRKHPLDSCFARVRRADEHIAALKARLDLTFMMQAYTLGIEFDPNPPHCIAKLRLPPETFYGMEFGILLGEIIYNLRSALDYLIFELAALDSGTEQSGTQFPIEDCPNRFAGNAPRMLAGLNPTHIAAIERLQPYNGCDWTQRLRDCSNPDKHRHLVPVGGNAGFTVYSSFDKDLTQYPGVERYAHHPIEGQSGVKVKVHITTEIAFSDGAPVIKTIEELKTAVAQTLADFKSEF